MDAADWSVAGAVLVLAAVMRWLLQPPREWEEALRVRQEELDAEREAAREGPSLAEEAKRNFATAVAEARDEDPRGRPLFFPPEGRLVRVFVDEDGGVEIGAGGMAIQGVEVPWAEVQRVASFEGRLVVCTAARAYSLPAEGEPGRALGDEVVRRAGLAAGSPSPRMREREDTPVFVRDVDGPPPGKERSSADLGSAMKEAPPSACRPVPALRSADSLLERGGYWRVVVRELSAGYAVFVFRIGETPWQTIAGEEELDRVLATLDDSSLEELSAEEDEGWRPSWSRAWERPIRRKNPGESAWRRRVRIGLEALEVDGDAPEEPAKARAAVDWSRLASLLTAPFVALAALLWNLGGLLLKGGGAVVKGAKASPTLTTMVLAAWSFATEWGWGVAVGTIALLWIHEHGHGVVMRAKGVRPGPILFVPFFGALVRMKDEPLGVASSAEIALGGPVVGALASAACWVVFRVTGLEFFGHLAWYGLGGNAFNLMPVFPLDGGRVVRAVTPWIWAITTPVALFGVLQLESGLVFCFFLLSLIAVSDTLWKRWREGPAPFDEAPAGYRWQVSAAYVLTALVTSVASGFAFVAAGGLALVESMVAH